ncbi:MAG: cobaltochelatase subunit CobN [Bianqueaceae bacterium]
MSDHTEDRLWNMKKAFRMLQQQYGDVIQGSCYSLWDVCQKPDAYAAMMEEARGCQYAIVYFHGGAQILPDFRGFWKQITAWMPAYFESSLPDEIAELMPSSGVTPEEYRTVQSYFQYADADNFAAMFLAIASARFDMPCPVPPPKPPLSRGFYRPGGPIPREEEEAVLRGAAESGRPVVGLILHQSQVLNGNTKHIEAIIERLEALGAYPLPLFTRMANDEDDKQGIKYAMGEYFIWRGRKLPDVILVLAGFPDADGFPRRWQQGAGPQYL